MKTKLLTLFLALTSAFMAKANVLPLDWDNIDPSYVYSCSRPTYTEYKALKYMKAACDTRYLYIRAGFDTQYIDINEDFGDDGFGGHPGVPFHVFLNNDRTNNGFIGMWNTPSFTLTEGFLFESGRPVSAYTPSTFYWVGDEPSRDWLWNEYSNQIVTESIITDSTIEMQISLATLPFTCNEYIHVGVEIEEKWSAVGILPLGEDNPEIGGFIPGIVDMAKVKISPTPIVMDLVVNHLGYNINKNTKTASVVSCEQDVTDIEIPNTIEYEGVTYSVTTIEEEAFWKCSGLTSVTIPNSVTAIGSSAFYGCSSLIKVEINSDTYLSQDFSSKYEQCPSNIFGSQVTEYVIGNSVITIGDWAFKNCIGLTSVTIGNSVTTIRNLAFFACTGLKSVYITNLEAWCKIHFDKYYDVANPLYYASTLYLNNQPLTDIVIPNTIDSIQSGAFTGYQGLTSLTIPSSVKYIGESAFDGCSNLSVLNLSEGIQNIDREAFVNTAISSIRLPQSVRYVNFGAFAYCKQVHKVEILGDITWREFETEEEEEEFYEEMQYALDEVPLVYASYYYLSAFPLLDTIIAPAGCFDLPESAWSAGTKSLKYVQVNRGELSENALQYINRSYKTLKTLDVSAVTNTEFADEAFEGCYNLESIVLPQSLERIGYMMVAGCKNLKSIDIPASVVEIDQSAFEDCRSIKTITFNGNQLKTIGNWAFYNAHQLQNLTLPEGVEKIGEGAFYGCVYLENLVLPRSTKSIGDNGFSLCSKLSKITVHSVTPPTIEAKTFYEVSRQIPVYVPLEVVNDYKSDVYWGEMNIIGVEMPTDLESVHDAQPTPKGLMRKVFRNGQLLIETNNATYTLMGQKVR